MRRHAHFGFFFQAEHYSNFPVMRIIFELLKFFIAKLAGKNVLLGDIQYSVRRAASQVFILTMYVEFCVSKLTSGFLAYFIFG